MSELIVFILLFLGIANSPDQVTDSMVMENQSAIQQTMDDPSFKNYYESVTAPSTSIGSVDTFEGD